MGIVTVADALDNTPSVARYVNVSVRLHTPRPGLYEKEPSGFSVN
jgi:hypothetical protein